MQKTVESAHFLTSRNVLLIGEDQQKRLFHFSVQYYPMQLLPSLFDAASVIRVDNEDETLCTYRNPKLASVTKRVILNTIPEK